MSWPVNIVEDKVHYCIFCNLFRKTGGNCSGVIQSLGYEAKYGVRSDEITPTYFDEKLGQLIGWWRWSNKEGR